MAVRWQGLLTLWPRMLALWLQRLLLFLPATAVAPLCLPWPIKTDGLLVSGEVLALSTACGPSARRQDVEWPRYWKTDDEDDVTAAAAATRAQKRRPLLGSWEYSGCGNKPCPGGTKLDIAPVPWTADDYVVRSEDGGARSWQTLIFTAGSNLTQAAQVHANVHEETGDSLPVLWEWNAWRTLRSFEPALLDASLRNFSRTYQTLVKQFPQLPSLPFGVALGDEPPWELVESRLAASAAAVKRHWPHAITHINLQFRTITNASVPPILGSAAGLDWVGSDLYYSDSTTTPPVNSSVAAFKDIYNRVVYPHLRPEQKIVLVPFAHYCEFYCPIGGLPLDHADAYTTHVARQYLDWADTDDRIAALLIYSLKMVWVPEGADACENPPYIVGSGNLTVTKWRTDWAGNGIALMDKCAQDARVAAQPCPPPLPPAPLAHLRAQWVKGDGGMLVLAASPAGAPLCLGHFIPPPPCKNPGHRTYKVVNGSNVPTCDNFLGEVQATSGLAVFACNSTQAVLQRQVWSCLDSTDCVGASRILAAGSPGCERLPNFRPPPKGVPVACCLTYGGGVFGLNQCGNMPGEHGSFGEQHFRFVPVESEEKDANREEQDGGARRFTIELAGSSLSQGPYQTERELSQGPQCVVALQPGYATPQTVATYQNWSLAQRADWLGGGETITTDRITTTRSSVSGRAPVLVSETSRAGEYVFFPQTLQWAGQGQLLLSYQTDSDALHPDGWTGAQFFSANQGRTWKPVPMSENWPWLVKPCVPHPANATGTALKGSVGSSGSSNTLLTCFEYPLRRPVSRTDHTHAHLRSATFESSARLGLRQVGNGSSTVTFPADHPLQEWGEENFEMVTDGGVLPLKDGSLMMTLYGNYLANVKQGPSNYSIVAVRSEDGGRNWRWLATVAHGAASPCDEPSENHCVRLADQSIYCVWRSHGPLCSSSSVDEGRTWTAGVPLKVAAPSSPALGVSPPPLSAACKAKLDAFCNDPVRNRDCIDATKRWYPDADPWYAVDGVTCAGLHCPADHNCTCTGPTGPVEYRCYSHLALDPTTGKWSATATHPNALCSETNGALNALYKNCTGHDVPPPPPPPPPSVPVGVEPKLSKLPSGKLVLSTGRPGLFVWVARDPPTGGWTAFNLAAHHNAAYSDASLHYKSTVPGGQETTSYTGMVAVPGEDAVIVSYDRLANGWSPAPFPAERSAIFTVRLDVH